ncbi:DUF6771 family protein [Sphingomonas sp. NIBR02145]|uniref:DUF6771 family protein n=1 Tax=Sphingomonas sp. NIBR02145 TaxID=3014784 RepID=UPI0022B3251D|nr:DUF6771 family protein [Sphingomonas sp. NIBR02145]WHU04339.1 hypothetical protein O3305_07050 [Sphingomonas sp. NIBR02145]
MSDPLQSAIADIIARAPEWIRQEMATKDHATRERAEEALAAMIANALKEADKSGT